MLVSEPCTSELIVYVKSQQLMHERTVTFVLKSTINTQCNVNNLFPFSFFIFKFEHILRLVLLFLF